MVVAGLVGGCDQAKVRMDDIDQMSASAANNAVFSTDEVATIESDVDGDGIDDIFFEAAFGTDVSNIVVDYIGDCDHVFVGEVEQQSGVTANDFTGPVIYSCANSEDARHDYTVHFGFEPASTEKRILTFGLTSALNDELATDAMGAVNGAGIGVDLPFGTDVSSLSPTFTFVGEQVLVGGAPQTSGVTAHDYRVPVGYVVRAQAAASAAASSTSARRSPRSRRIRAASRHHAMAGGTRP